MALATQQLGQKASAMTTGPQPVVKKILGPWLVDANGQAIWTPTTIWAVVRQAGARATLVDAVPGTPLSISPAALSHIINRHSDAARTATLARIAAGQSKLADFQNVGYFFPQYSSPPAVVDLIQDVYNASGPPDIGPSRGNGQFAIFAGALFLRNNQTGQTIPILIGRDGLTGNATNVAALFVTSDNQVQTMYPCGLVTQYHPQ